jgi:hypothetical protein
MIQGLLIIALMSGTFLFPAPAVALNEPLPDEEEQTIAPSVVRQGDFALRLAQALNLPASEEGEAARALTALGIQPVGGWVADYPMTPQIVAELRNAVVAAATAGRLVMRLDAAMRAFTELVAEFGLPLPAEPAPGYAGGGAAPATAYGPSCNGTALDYYYGNFGMPLYSYCPPPAAYYYLYSWVPYGFYWHQHVFTGFFIRKHFDAIPPRARHGDHRHRFKDDRDGKKHDRDHRLHRRVFQTGPGVQPEAIVTPGIGNSEIPGIGRSDSPGIGRSDTPGIGRSDTPGIGRSDTSGIDRSTPSNRVRTGERPASSGAHHPRHLTPSAPAGSTAKRDGSAKRWVTPAASGNLSAQPPMGRAHAVPPSPKASGLAPARVDVTPAPVQAPPAAAPLERRRMSREISERGSSDGRGTARWRPGLGQ